MSPYREAPVPEPTAAAEGAERCPDRDLAALLFLAWALSVARVLYGLGRHETFGTDGSFAFLAIFIVPYLMKDAIRWCFRRALRPRRR